MRHAVLQTSLLSKWPEFTREQQALGLSVISLLGLVYHREAWAILQFCLKGLATGVGRVFSITLRDSKRSHLQIGPVKLTDEARARHLHAVGATGTGKTTFLEHLIQGDIERGYGAIIIDPKGDRALYEKIREICARHGRSDDLHLLSATYPEESSRWNPFRLGNAAELQAKFFNAQEWSEPFYKKACEAALLRAFKELLSEFPKGFTVREFSEKLKSLAKEQRESKIEGLFFDFLSLTEGPWAEILGAIPQNKSLKEIHFLDVTRKNEIVFVDLPTESQSVQSKRLGKILLQEIVLISGLRKQYPALHSAQPFSVIIDEFDAFATETFATFLNKGRSSGFMITLAHQTLGDLDRVSPAFKDQILGNPNIRVVFRQDTPSDAELWSQFFGTQLTIKSTYQTLDGEQTGTASNREVQEFRFHPDQIKELRTGECIVSIKTENSHRKIRVPLPKLPSIKLPELRQKMENDTMNRPSLEKVEQNELTISEFIAKDKSTPNRHLLLFVAMTILTSSCAFKPSPQEVEIAALQKLDGRVLEAQFQWEGKTDPILLKSHAFQQKAAKTWERDQVVSLPVKVPEEIFLNLNLAQDPQSLGGAQVSGAFTTGADLKDKHISVDLLDTTPAEIGTLLRLRLTGLNHLFRENEEQRVYFSLEIKSKNGSTILIEWTLSTPPSRLTRLKTDPHSGRSAQKPEPLKSLQQLKSQAESLELIQHVEFRNDSFEQMNLQIPLKNHGIIRLRGKRFWAEKAESSPTPIPRYEQKETEEIHDFEGVFFIFPLTDDLPTRWTGITQSQLNSIKLNPGQTILLGIYATADTMKQIASYTRSQPHTELKTVSGVAQCPAQAILPLPPPGPNGSNEPNAEGYCDLYGPSGPFMRFPDPAIALCKEALPILRACRSSNFSDTELCNRAALYDQELFHASHPQPGGTRITIVLLCSDHPPQILIPSNPSWIWQPIHSNFKVGLQTLPVTVDWDTQSISMSTRFSVQNEASSAIESRNHILFQNGFLLNE